MAAACSCRSFFCGRTQPTTCHGTTQTPPTGTIRTQAHTSSTCRTSTGGGESQCGFVHGRRFGRRPVVCQSAARSRCTEASPRPCPPCYPATSKTSHQANPQRQKQVVQLSRAPTRPSKRTITQGRPRALRCTEWTTHSTRPLPLHSPLPLRGVRLGGGDVSAIDGRPTGDAAAVAVAVMRPLVPLLVPLLVWGCFSGSGDDATGAALRPKATAGTRGADTGLPYPSTQHTERTPRLTHAVFHAPATLLADG